MSIYTINSETELAAGTVVDADEMLIQRLAMSAINDFKRWTPAAPLPSEVDQLMGFWYKDRSGQGLGIVALGAVKRILESAVESNDIDTRSDVYSLGVVLYELLCKQLPYDVGRRAIHEVARVILEQQPNKPSTINRTLRGDVETIALKALEKKRDRRYRSASELSEDIRRYLSSEPIMARPPQMPGRQCPGPGSFLSGWRWWS